MIPPIQKKTSMLAHYLLELALQEYQFLKYLPSVVADCCLSMAMYTIDGFPMVSMLRDVGAISGHTLLTLLLSYRPRSWWMLASTTGRI